jgi:hypothetical protein
VALILRLMLITIIFILRLIIRLKNTLFILILKLINNFYINTKYKNAYIYNTSNNYNYNYNTNNKITSSLAMRPSCYAAPPNGHVGGKPNPTLFTLPSLTKK